MWMKDYFAKAGLKRTLIGVIIGNIFVGLGFGVRVRTFYTVLQ